MEHSQTYYDLLEVFGEKGCPVCLLTLQGVQEYLESLNYEYVNDPGFRAEVEPAHGFCPTHADQWVRTAHVLGTALIYQSVLRQVDRDLEHLHFGRSNHSLWAGLASAVGIPMAQQRIDGSECETLRPSKVCPACLRRAELETMTIATIVEGLKDTSFADAYHRSSLLCLPHLRQALCASTSDMTFTELRDAALTGNMQLEAQLAEVIRKHDYRFHDETIGVEHDAVARSVRSVAGMAGIDHR